MRIKYPVIAFFLLGVMNSCELIDYHPYDGRTDGCENWNRHATERIEAACNGKDTIRFILMGDTQRWYDETEAFVTHMKGRTDVDFVIHGGDITDFGMTKEFEWVHRIMSKLSIPYVALIGNHDVIGNGLQIYHSMYGDENFSFVAGNTKFVCLNTNALEFDYSHPVPDFSFLRQEIADTTQGFDRTVVAMHVQPYGEQFDNNVADPFQHYLLMLRNLEFCLHAHTHALQANDIFGDGIMYYGCSKMKDRNYYLFTMTPGGYSYEVVSY